MKFQEFFEKNYKLIKLNFILLGTLIFFLVLQLGQQSYAVTDEDLATMGLTVADWTQEVLEHNNISENIGYIVWKSWDYDKEAIHTYLYTYPDFSNDTMLFFTSKSTRMLMNFTSHTNLDNILKTHFGIQNTNDMLHLVTYDYDLNGHSFTNKYEATWTENTLWFHQGTIEEFVLDNNIRLGNYAVHDVNVGLEYIQYTNFKNYFLTDKVIREFSEDKKLVTYDYDSYIKYDSDEYGNYIAIDSSIKSTNVHSIIFGGNNLMDGLNDYILDVSINLETFKLYVNDSPDVDITFHDSGGKILYNTLKVYKYVIDDLENFDYGSCIIYGIDTIGGNYITLDEKLKGTDVLLIVFQGIFNNLSSTKFSCTTLTDFSLVKLYTDYPENVLITMHGADGIIWSNVNDVVINEPSYKFVTFFEYYDTLDTINGTLNKLYYGKARMNFDLLNSQNESFDIRTLSDMAYGYDFSYRFKYIYSDETTDENYSDWYSVYDIIKNEKGYYYLDLVYGNIIGLFVELAINVTDYSTSETITYSYSTYSFSLLKGTKDGLLYWFDGNDGHPGRGDYVKFNHIASNDVFIYDSTGNAISGVTSGQDVDFDFGFGVGNILDGFTTVIDTIKNGFSTLVGSVNSVGTLFSTAFSWLPTPIPELIKVVFGAMVLFAIIKFIRG